MNATDRSRYPWEIIKAQSTERGGVRIWGINHYRGDRFVWEIDPRFFRLDPRYDFYGCQWMDEKAREIVHAGREAEGEQR